MKVNFFDLSRMTNSQIDKLYRRGSLDFKTLSAQVAPLIEEVRAVVSLDGLEVEGLYTHFASADIADKAPTTRQLQAFRQVVRALRAGAIELPVLHAANSAAFLDLPESHLDMARLGILTAHEDKSPWSCRR